MQKKSKSKRYVFLLALLALVPYFSFFSNVSHAATCPTEVPVIIPPGPCCNKEIPVRPIPPYGNAELPCFKKAMEGGYESERADRVGRKEEGRFYLRLGVNSSVYTINSLKNKSFFVPATGTTVNSSVISTSRASRSGLGAEVAFGYVSDPNFRYELEYLINPTFTYNINTIFTTATVPQIFVPSTMRVQANALLLNFYYDFWEHYRFRPFVMAGIGVGVVSLTGSVGPLPPLTTTSNSQSMRTGSFAFDVGLGFRVNFFNDWFLYASYRYINYGLSRLTLQIPLTGTGVVQPVMQGNFSQNALSFGVMYLF